MDDLGRTYQRGARAECSPNQVNISDDDLLVEYINRLNPSVKVEVIRRTDFTSHKKKPLMKEICMNYSKGEAPKETLLENVQVDSADEEKGDDKVIVHCVEGECHDVSKGDRLKSQWTNDDGEINDLNTKIHFVVGHVKNPTCFAIKVISMDDGCTIKGENLHAITKKINQNANSFSRVKLAKSISFLSLKEALAAVDDPSKEIFAPSDLDKSFDVTRRGAVISSFTGLESYLKDEGCLPSIQNVTSFVDRFGCRDHDKNFNKIVNSFGKFANSKFTPLQAIYGALGAQEALKAASGLYNPIKQFLLYDCDEILIGLKHTKDKANARDVSGLRNILGNKLFKKLTSKNKILHYLSSLSQPQCRQRRYLDFMGNLIQSGIKCL